MTTDVQGIDPYEAVIADLKAQRAKIDETIALLTGLRSGSGARAIDASSSTPAVVETAGMYLGMSIADAAKKLLSIRMRTLGNVEIARELQAGGLAMNSKDPVNTIGSVLTRRFNEVGDVVKVGRGIWGLKEWYPNRTFKRSGKGVSKDTSANGEVRSEVDGVLELDERLAALVAGSGGQDG